MDVVNSIVCVQKLLKIFTPKNNIDIVFIMQEEQSPKSKSLFN